MKKVIILIMLFKVINLIALNTEYPEINTYSDEWQKAGLNVEFPANNEYNVVNLSNANGSNINDLIDSYSDLEIGNQVLIKIPAGTFTVTEPIVMKSYVTIKGNHMFKKDSDLEYRTILIFDFDNDYSGNTPTEITRHDHQKNCFVVHGEEVNNIVNQIKSAGIEDLYIQRKDYGQSDDMTDGNNISFRYASNCWVTGVESGKCSKNHINATESQHLYISGCYFHVMM